MAKTPQLARRYAIANHELNIGRGLAVGDVYIGFPYFPDPGSKTNPEGKVTLLYRESDSFRADTSEYWNLLRELPGRVRIEFDLASKSWQSAGPRSKPTPRAKRFQPSR